MTSAPSSRTRGPIDPTVLPHLQPGRAALTVGLAAGLVGGLAVVAQAFAVGHLVVSLVSGPGSDTWHASAGWLLGTTLVRALCAWTVDSTAARAAGQVTTVLRDRLLRATLGLGRDDRERHTAGALTVLATRGLAALEPYLTRYLPTVVLAAVLPLAAVVAIFALDWLSGLIVVLTLPLVPVFATLIGMSTQEKADRQWRQLQGLSGHFLDVVRGLETLVVHRRATAQSATIRRVTDTYRRSTLDTLRTAFASSAALELVATLSVALVAVCVGLRLAADGIDFDTALVVLLLAPEAYWPLRRVGAEFHAAAEGAAAFARADELLAAAQRDDADQRTLATDPAAGLHVEGVSFTHADRDTPALAPLTHTFPTRGLVAVAGPSGCGKSTLLSLLSGERHPSTGRVLVGDVDLTRVHPGEWRRHVATQAQRPWLTGDSIADNLRTGRPEASDADLWQALDQVDLADHVRALPQRLDTLLGEDGAGLSAGQRARLALARVVVADRPVVLLDEPSAHLDARTEAAMLRTLTDLAADRLVVVVAHRDAVVRAADAVLTLRAPTHADEPQPVLTVHENTPDEADTPAPSARASVVTPATVGPGHPRRSPRTAAVWGTLLGTGSVASGVALTATAAWLITRASQHPPVLYLMVAIVGVRMFGLARPVLRWTERIVSHDAALQVLAERRARVYDVLVPLVPGALGRRRGDLLTSVVEDVDSLVDAELRVRQPIWTGLLVGLTATLVAWLVAPPAGVVTGLVTVLAALVLLAVRALLTPTEARFVTARAELADAVEHVVHNARELVQWQAGEPALARVHRAGDAVAGAATRTVRVVAAGQAAVVAACGAGVVAVAATVTPGTGSGAALTALVVMLPLALADALVPLADAGALSVRTRRAAQRLAALEELSPLVTDPDVASEQADGPDVLAWHGATLGWDDHEVVRDLDLRLEPGSRTALVGPSGVGKSTVAASALRFLDPSAGEVTWRDAPLRSLRLDDLRRDVSLLGDDPYLFASTVRENVRLARPDASDADVDRALERARLGTWTAGLPAGPDTFIGEGHAHVSGGERARIGVARALLADPDVLVLDEPTAHLDSETAHAVAGELLDGAGAAGRTLLWITHGTVALEAMDVVVRLGAEPAAVAAPA